FLNTVALGHTLAAQARHPPDEGRNQAGAPRIPSRTQIDLVCHRLCAALRVEGETTKKPRFRLTSFARDDLAGKQQPGAVVDDNSNRSNTKFVKGSSIRHRAAASSRATTAGAAARAAGRVAAAATAFASLTTQ
ncbi:hypothetical protein Vretifemale_4394, partial [Volvox reticuliferus]